MTRFSSLTALAEPQSVAIIGASNDPDRIGGRALKYMLNRRFAGSLYPVNPNRETVQGVRAYDSIAALPERPDVALVSLPANLVVGAVKDLANAGVKSAVVFSAGFAETGPAGVALQQELIDAAGPMRFLGPNSLGLFNERINFWGTFTASLETGWPVSGRIGIASQSGAYGSHIMCAAREQGLGTSILITTGNEADITTAEAIGWMAEHDDVDTIVSYVEGVRNGPQMIAALECARAARKPVIMLKAGRSVLGSQAAQSHTAALAGDDAVIDAILRDLGVIRVSSTQEALDIAKAAQRRIFPVDNTLGVLTVSGGAGIIIADEAERHGVALTEMPEDARARMQEKLAFAATRNPVDCTAQALNQLSLTGDFGEEMVKHGNYSAMLTFFSHAGGVPSIVPGLRAELRRIRDARPEVLHVLSILGEEHIVDQYESDGYLVYDDPSRAVRAIAAMAYVGKAFAATEKAPLPDLPQFELPTITPNEADAKAFLSELGLSIAREVVCADADQAAAAAESLGYPVVMKILSADIPHKTEIGGVLTGVQDAEGVREGHATLMRRAAEARPDARIDGVLVARQIERGVECIMGVQYDPVFGPMALFGLGGIHVEVFKDVVLSPCPFGVDRARELVRSIRGVALLDGVRGAAPVDIEALAQMLSRLSVLAANAGPRLVSVDLNPVIATPDGAWAVDALMEIDSAQGTPGTAAQAESAADIQN